MIKLPQNGKFVQPNNSNLLGSIWSSFNIDLNSNKGSLKVSPRMKMCGSSDTGFTNGNADMGLPVAFKILNNGSGVNQIYALCGAYIFENDGTPNRTFTKNSTTGFPTTLGLNSDMEIFSNTATYIYVTPHEEDKIYYLSESKAWANFTQSLDSTSVHLLITFENRMYVTNLHSIIYSWSTYNGSDMVSNGTSDYSLQLGNSNANTISTLRSTSSRVWIGTVNLRGNKGYIYEWDGVTGGTNIALGNGLFKAYRLESAGVVACVIKNDIPYFMDVEGNLLEFNGVTFNKIASLPVERKLLGNSLVASNARYIHPNGISLINGNINILVNATNRDYGSTQNENCPSGIWEYTKENGFVHKHGVNRSPTDALTTDYGQFRVSAVGALSDMNIRETTSTVNGTLLAGATYYTDATTTKNGIFYNDNNNTEAKTGYFVTPKILSADIQDTWGKLALRFKRLNSGDKIIVKYRVIDADPTEVTATWATTTTFTTTTNVLGKEGYEVEIIQGYGGGKTAHITTIDVDGGTYTVHLDETITGATGTAKARIQNWIKLKEFSTVNADYFTENLEKSNVWIQFKVYFEVTGEDEFYDLSLTNISNVK